MKNSKVWLQVHHFNVNTGQTQIYDIAQFFDPDNDDEADAQWKGALTGAAFTQLLIKLRNESPARLATSKSDALQAPKEIDPNANQAL